MERIEENTRPQGDRAQPSIILSGRLTKFNISNRSYNFYPGSFFRPGRRIPLRELLEQGACWTHPSLSFHRRD